MNENNEELLSDEAEDKCREVSSAELEVMYTHGKAHYDKGEYDKARELWTKAAALGDVNARDALKCLPDEFEIKDGVLVKYYGKGGDVIIPDGVTSIGEGVFKDCIGLTSISISKDVTSISRSAFDGYKGLTSIEVSSDNEKYYSVCNCLIEKATKTVVLGCKNSIIPNDGSVTSIGSYAFSDCSGLTCIAIPNSVTSIADHAFFGCRDLTSIEIPNSVKSIGFQAFSYCSGLMSITIPNGVTSIGSYAFSYCSGLTSITIPNSVTSIGEGAFSGCRGLTSISVSSGNERYYSVCNCIIEKATKTFVLGCKNSIIPNDGSVTSIGSYAFSGSSGLTSITIPNSVTSIGGSAFEGCSGLTSITIPNGVTSIGGAFSHCSGLTSITISSSVTSIDFGALFFCSELKEIKYMGTKREWKKVKKDRDWYINWNMGVVICSNGKVKIK